MGNSPDNRFQSAKDLAFALEKAAAALAGGDGVAAFRAVGRGGRMRGGALKPVGEVPPNGGQVAAMRAKARLNNRVRPVIQPNL